MGPQQDDTQLYLRIATKMAVDLPEEKDRVLALKWLKFLQKTQDPNAKRTKLHATQLLLICLQRKRLVGPFIEAPDPQKKLTQYGWAYQPADIARLILKAEFDKIARAPFFVEISGDMSEYVAAQEIPQFGAHCYYAFSPEHLPLWDGLNTEYIPKGYLAISATESPGASILAGAIAEAMNEKKRAAAARIVVPEGQRKRSEFTGASMLDEATGALHEQFMKEVPPVKGLKTKMMEDALKRGAVDAGDLALPADIAGGKSAEGGVKVGAPLVENVELRDGDVTISKSQKLKNAGSKKQKKKTKKAFDAIKEEEDEGTKAKADFERKVKEQEARRQELIAMMPPHLQKRMMEQQRKKEKKEQEEKVKTPEAFRTGKKSTKFKKTHQPEEFGLSEKEQFGQAVDIFGELDYTSPVPARKTVWVGKDMPSAERERERGRLGLPGSPGQLAGTPTDRGKSPLQKEIEASWDRAVKKMYGDQGAPSERKSISPARKTALDRLARLKTIQPRKVIFDEMDVQVEPEEVSFQKFVYTEFSDEDRTPSILEDSKMEGDAFADGEISPGKLKAPISTEAIEKAQLLLDTEMETDDVFAQDDVSSPAVIFKEVAVEGERLVSPAHPSESPREGGVKIGKRVVEIPGQKPMEQHFVETYGDVVFNESLRAIDPGVDPQSLTPPMTEQMLNRYLDQKLKQMKPGESPRVYGPWAKSFKQDLERLERGEQLQDFPEEDASKYVYPHDLDRSVISDTEMDTSKAFEKQKTAIPSPIVMADARRQSEVFAKLKDAYEVKKARKIQKALSEQQDMEFFPPSIQDTPPIPAVLEGSVVDAALGLVMVDGPGAPNKQSAFDSFEKRLDESLALFADDDMEDRPGTAARIVYDEGFLDRRIQDDELPADDSVIEDIDAEFFDQEDVAEPPKVQQIPLPKAQTPPKQPSPVRQSHLFLPDGRYRPAVEDIVPHDFVAEQSFPEDIIEQDLEISPVESSISVITAPPDEDMPEVEEEAQEEIDEQEGDITPQLLAEDAMATEDVFGEGTVKTPSPFRRTSPTTFALAKSIKEAVTAQKFINKYRESTGLPPQQPAVPFEGISEYVDAREDLLDPVVQAEVREQFPGIIDEPILEDELDQPLVKSPEKKDILADYEQQMMDELLEEQAQAAQDELLPEDLMEDEVFLEDEIAEPDLCNQLAMPSPRKSIEPISATSPIRHSHLFMTERPMLKPIEAPSVVPEEKLDEQLEPEQLSFEDKQLLNTLFDGEIPASMAEAPQGQSPPRSPRSPDIVHLDGAEEEAEDIFGAGQVSPRQVEKSTALQVLDQSQKISQNIHDLRNRFRKMRSLPPVEEPVDTEPVEQLKLAEEALRHILAEPEIDDSEFTGEGGPQAKAALEAFEREMDESQRQKEDEIEALDAEEMSDIFEKEAFDEPLRIKDIPMPQKTKSPSPPPPPRFSHLQMPRVHALPLPCGIEGAELMGEEFPKDISEEVFEMDPSGIGEQLQVQEEPQYEEAPPIQRPQVPKPPKQPSLFDQSLPEDDLYYNLLRSPEHWRENAIFQAVNRAIEDSGRITSLRNKFRAMKGLEPLPEDEDRKEKLSMLAATIREQEQIIDHPPLPATPKRFEDPFQSFEEDVKKELYPSPPAAERSLIEDEQLANVYHGEQFATPTHIKALPFPSPKPSPVLTPTSPKTPPPRYVSPIRPLSPVKPYKPDLQSYLPQEEILEQSIPALDESGIEPMISPRISPRRSPTKSPRRSPTRSPTREGPVLPAQELPQVQDRAVTPEKVAAEYALARSLRISEDYKSLKNKVRSLRGLPPVEEPSSAQHLRNFLEKAADLLEPINIQDVADKPTGLLDEAVPDDLDAPLLSPPRKKDLLADFEQQLDRELYPTPSPLEKSLLAEQEFDVFGEDAYATPLPVKAHPMPSPKPSPVLTPRSPQTPPFQPAAAVRHSHLFVTGPIVKPEAPPPVPEGPLLYEDQQLLAETPPDYMHKVCVQEAFSPVFTPPSPPRGPPILPPIPDINIIPATPPRSPVISPKPPSRGPSPLRVPSPQKVSPPRPPSPVKSAYTPIGFDFQDEIGPPEFEESPGLIQFRETLPGVYEPKRDVDKERFADRQRLIMANKYGVSPEAIPHRMLDAFSPPKLDVSIGSPGFEAHLFDDGQVSPKKVAPALAPEAAVVSPSPRTPPKADAPYSRKLAPKQLFPAKDQLPLRLSPSERMRQFLAMQPRIELQPLPRKTGLSPQDFITHVLSPREEELEMQAFPEDEDYRPSEELGDLAYALYIPTEADMQEAAELEKRREEQFKTPPDFKYKASPPRPVERSPIIPIQVREVLPHEEGFKWLGNYIPFSKQTHGQQKGGIIPAELPKQKAKAKQRKSEIKASRVSSISKDLATGKRKSAATPVPAKKKQPTKVISKSRVPLRPSSPPPPPGMAIRRPGEQPIKQSSAPPPEVRRKSMPGAETPKGRPSIPSKRGFKTPLGKRSSVAVRKSVTKTPVPRKSDLTVGPPTQKRTPASVQRQLSQPKVATPGTGPRKQTIRRLSHPSLKEETPKRPPSAVKLPPAEGQRPKILQRVSEPKLSAQPIQAIRSRMSQASILKTRGAEGTVPSRRKSQVTFHSPLVPHWQSPPRYTPPRPSPPQPIPPRRASPQKQQAQVAKQLLPEMPKSKILTGKSGLPLPKRSGIPLPGRSGIPLPAQSGVSQVQVKPPQPPQRMSLPAAATRPPLPPATGGPSLARSYTIHDDVPAGPSDWLYQPERSPIQATSFRYKAPSTSPDSPRRSAPSQKSAVSQRSIPDDIPAGPSNWLYRSEKSPIQATSFRYRAPSASPVSPQRSAPLQRSKSVLKSITAEQLEAALAAIEQTPGKEPITAQRLQNALTDAMISISAGPSRTPQEPRTVPYAAATPVTATPKPKARIAVPVRKETYPSKLAPPKAGIPRPSKMAIPKAYASQNAIPQAAAPKVTQMKSIKPPPPPVRGPIKSKLARPSALQVPSQVGLSKKTPSAVQTPFRDPRKTMVPKVTPKVLDLPREPSPARPPLPAEMRGATAEMQITKTKSETTQGLLKKSSVVRKTGLPPPRVQVTGKGFGAGLGAQQPKIPDLDRRTLTQSMMVGKVGKDSAVRKQSTIQIQHDENRQGAKMVKTNVLQSIKPGEVKKLESKFAMRQLPPPSGLPPPTGIPRPSDIPKASGIPKPSGIPKLPPRMK